ncbi:hypothetical protein [Flavobacterium succinicans]|uniref:Uncharacterized protein n=1 Tax=Flavobacterium succinicans TaxID=29536 RepID=A0A199XSS9_9FLAO|nr:hypothetical protein [Flavobacterium succinicans]OAZ04477.1 hypothetical protein FLB_11230 [Flavobacterium succinicans]
MNEIFIIKKIQIGERTFPVENQNSKLSFNFYCGNGGVKHKTILSLKDSDLLDSLIENAKIDYKDLVKNDVDKLQNLEDRKRPFPYRFQIYNSQECNNNYLLIFDIYEFRGYYGFTIYGVLQIESTPSINNYEQN